MPIEDLPVPPTYDELIAWAGAGRVIRAQPADLAGWQLPDAQKAALLDSGVPLVEDLIDTVTFRTDRRRGERGGSAG